MSKLPYSIYQLVGHTINIFIDFSLFLSANFLKAIRLGGLLIIRVIFLEKWEPENKHAFRVKEGRKGRVKQRMRKKLKEKETISFDQLLALI